MYVDEQIQTAIELEEKIDNVQNDADYNLAQRDQETEEKIRGIEAAREKGNAEQKERYDILADKLSQAYAYNTETRQAMQAAHESQMRDIDREQETRLGKEYEKQNRLLQEIQSLREKSRLDLASLEESYESQIEALKKHNEAALKEWRNEYDRVTSMLKTDGLKFEEALRQQEQEYEEELDDLEFSKKQAIRFESDRYNASLRDTVSMKNSVSSLQAKAKVQEAEIQKHQEKMKN